MDLQPLFTTAPQDSLDTCLEMQRETSARNDLHILAILPETKQCITEPFYNSTRSTFLWSYKLDQLQDGSVAAQGFPERVGGRGLLSRSKTQKLDTWDTVRDAITLAITMESYLYNKCRESVNSISRESKSNLTQGLLFLKLRTELQFLVWPVRSLPSLK